MQTVNLELTFNVNIGTGELQVDCASTRATATSSALLQHKSPGTHVDEKEPMLSVVAGPNQNLDRSSVRDIPVVARVNTGLPGSDNPDHPCKKVNHLTDLLAKDNRPCEADGRQHKGDDRDRDADTVAKHKFATGMPSETYFDALLALKSQVLHKSWNGFSKASVLDPLMVPSGFVAPVQSPRHHRTTEIAHSTIVDENEAPGAPSGKRKRC